MAKRTPDPQRVVVLIPPRLLQRIDEFRWRNRLPSRAAAIRRLAELALNQNELPRLKKPHP